MDELAPEDKLLVARARKIQRFLSQPFHVAEVFTGSPGKYVSLAETIERVGPFGAGQPAPLFVFPAHRVLYADPVGQDHLRLTLGSAAGGKLKAMAFRAAGRPLGDFLLANRGAPIHIAGHLDIDRWQGEPRVQIRVVDAAEIDRRQG